MFSFLFCFFFASAKVVSSYVINLSGSGDIVIGETIQFKAEVLQDDGRPTHDMQFKFDWSDNASPPNTAEFVMESPSVWNITYNSSFPAHTYEVTVKGFYRPPLFFWVSIGSDTKHFKVSPYLKGDLVLTQGNDTRKKYVSNSEPVNHEISLQKSHMDFLNKTKNFIRTFWFVDCIYYGMQKNFDFKFNYSAVESIHKVEAILMSTYVPELSPELISNTNVTSNSTVNGTNSTVSSGNSTSNGTNNLDYLEKGFVEWLKNYNQAMTSNISRTEYCINSSSIPMAHNYTYGFFKRNFTVKAPVRISPINGTNWLMDGEVLNISVSCNGSSPYLYCVLLKSGLYNITGNETCPEENVLKNCSFGIQHLFKKPTEYTLVVIISNAVSHVVKPIAVNIYKVKKHAQLSVIIVPVSFSIIATIMIIFGVAYYVQSKRKYTIEVADFDFGNQTSNMEYKTFTERLRESISNSLLKSHDYQESDDSWPESASNSRKYGSME